MAVWSLAKNARENEFVHRASRLAESEGPKVVLASCISGDGPCMQESLKQIVLGRVAGAVPALSSAKGPPGLRACAASGP